MDEKLLYGFNINSNDSVSLEIEAKTCLIRKKKSKITWDLRYPT
jgi:hypothetical protein